jgi:3-phenylpropionate/trans-cinnamate dioxygenase ferredoxin reductase subunit
VRAEVAIVGNGVAGTACATRLARHGVRPLLVGRGLPVDRPPLTKAALAAGTPRLLADAERLAERGVDTLDAMVHGADLAARTLLAGDVEIEAGAIVLATGLSYRPPRIPGLDLAHVNATPGGMTRLAAALAGAPKRVAIVGAGLIGVETAATLAGLGHTVTLLDAVERPLDRLHDPIPQLVAGTLHDLGITFAGGVAITEVVAQGEVATIRCDDGSFTADVVVAATGGRVVAPPGLELSAPVEVAADVAVPGYERVYAVGDLALVPHARFGLIRFPQWDAAVGTGEQAADAIAGVAGPYERLPYWWSDIGPRRLAEVGVAERAVEWRAEDGLHVGRAVDGAVAAVLVVDEPRRLREARALLAEQA